MPIEVRIRYVFCFLFLKYDRNKKFAEKHKSDKDSWIGTGLLLR